MVPRKLASPLRVFVVDDFPDGCELVAEYLTFRGFDVHVAWPRVLKRGPAGGDDTHDQPHRTSDVQPLFGNCRAPNLEELEHDSNHVVCSRGQAVTRLSR